VDEVSVGPFRLLVPTVATLDVAALAIAIGASVAVFRYRAPTLAVLAVSAAIGGVWYLVAAGP
jgi:hypothetical protein